MPKAKQNKKKIDFKFLTGLGMLVFLILINSYVKDIPVELVVIPAIIMALGSLSPSKVDSIVKIIRAFKGK